MAQELTADDFQHVHEELMRHKELIYELKEKCRKYEAELQSRAATKTRGGFSKLIYSSKESSDLQRENAALRAKLAKEEQMFSAEISRLKSELNELKEQAMATHSVSSGAEERADDKILVCRSTSPMQICTAPHLDVTPIAQEFGSSEALRINVDSITDSIQILSSKLQRMSDKLHLVTITSVINDMLASITGCNRYPGEAIKNRHVNFATEMKADKDEEIKALSEVIVNLRSRMRASQKKNNSMIKDLQRELRSLRINSTSQREYRDSSDMITEDRSVDSLTDETRSMSPVRSTYHQLNENRSLRDSFRLSYQGRLLGLNDEQRSAKLTNLQSERDVLTEKVRHLEASNASMANDIVEKSKLIQQLILTKSASDQNSLSVRKSWRSKSTVPYIEVEGLQRALEATLNRNIEMEKIIKELKDKLTLLQKEAT